MKEQLKAALLAEHPSIKPLLAERYVAKYIKAVIEEIATQYAMMNDEIEDDELDFAVDRVNTACGRLKLNGKTLYIYQRMREQMTTSLVIETYQGNSKTHRVSRVIFNPNYKKGIMDELGSLAVELNPAHLRDTAREANHKVKIDLESLNSYIQHTREALKNPPSDAYKTKLLRNLQIANHIASHAIQIDGIDYMQEYWEEIDSGRVHGHGLSLQRMPKEVRHAALGRCHRYDFKAASYALMTSFALLIDPTLKVAGLTDYIKNRSAIRKRIAADVGISEEWMKSIFTAIGFGAELKDNPFNSIRGKIGQEKYHKLICNQEFIYIKRQLDQISDTIHKYAGNGDFELLGRPYTQINPKDGKKRTKNQKLAWIYQCLESQALSVFVKSLPPAYDIRLKVHDCLYLTQKLSAPDLANIKFKLLQESSLLNFEHDEIIPIHAPSFVHSRERELLRLEQEHRQRIAEETIRAANYTPIFCEIDTTPVPKKQVMTPWGAVDADLLPVDVGGAE